MIAKEASAHKSDINNLLRKVFDQGEIPVMKWLRSSICLKLKENKVAITELLVIMSVMQANKQYQKN